MKELIKKILKEETEPDENLPQSHPIIKAIKKFAGHDYKGVYYHPWEESYFDFIIKYHVKKVSLWSTKGYENRDYHLRAIYHPEPENLYEGTIHIEIDSLLVGVEVADEWEKTEDLPEGVWEQLNEHIIHEIKKWLPKVGLDIEIIF